MVFTLLSRIWAWFWRLVGYGILLVILLFGVQRSTIPLGLQWNAISLIVQQHRFDYVRWEFEALSSKVNQTLFGLHPFMDEAAASQYVRDYMADLVTVQQLEAQINRIYADPAIADPDAASVEERATRDEQRRSLAARQPLVEGILEGQVAAVLVEQGFGTLGQLLPPMSMHFTQVPNLLIVSPRDEIRFDVSINVVPLPVDEISVIETRIEAEHDVSALIVPLGGIALYPAMIIETTSIERAVEVFAHEWLHHYLFAFPLGLNYDFAGDARVINETTAQIFGLEIVPLVMARFYPMLATTQVPSNPNAVRVAYQTEDAPFNYGVEMDITRRRVDELLTAGDVEAAEAYMEERRAWFVANGYLLRRINQAYFAFYGGYQTGAPGVAGADPVGPAVRALLDASPSIHDWVVTMRDITTREQLLAVRDEIIGPVDAEE